MDQSRLELLCGLSGLDRLQTDWQRLCGTLSDASFAQSWEWHRSFVENLAAPDDALYVTVRERGEVVAIIPLFRETSVIAGISCAVWKLPAHEHMPLTDVIATPERARTIPLPPLLQEIHSRTGAFDALVLGPVFERSAAAALARVPELLTATEPAGHSDALPALPLDQLLGRMSRDFRSSLSRGRKKLNNLAGVRVVHAHQPEELEAAFPRFLRVEASGWKGAAGTGTAIALDPRLRNFYAQLVRRMGETGHCEIHVLEVDDVPIAASLGAVYGRRYYQIKIGYDEKWAQFAPGNALLEHVLKSYAGHPTVKHVDLVSGAHWHERWRPDVRSLVQQFVFRPTARGRLAWATLHGKQALRPVRKLVTTQLAALRGTAFARAAIRPLRPAAPAQEQAGTSAKAKSV